jgi:hypothetical protein
MTIKYVNKMNGWRMWEKGDEGMKGTEEWKKGAGGNVLIWTTAKKKGNMNDDTMNKWIWLENTKEKKGKR